MSHETLGDIARKNYADAVAKEHESILETIDQYLLNSRSRIIDQSHKETYIGITLNIDIFHAPNKKNLDLYMCKINDYFDSEKLQPDIKVVRSLTNTNTFCFSGYVSWPT